MALMMQVDYGDYKQGNKYPHQVEVQEPIENLEAKVMREYQKLTGLSTEIAIEKFLNGVAKLPLYGVELYPTSGQDRYVGIGPEGITLYTWGKMPLKS